jgi:hypothetical protein
MTTVVLALAVSGLLGLTLVGCAGAGDDICTMATSHLEACLGTTVQQSGTCNEAMASRILAANCSDLSSEGTRNPYFLDDFWNSLFGGGGGGGGGGDQGGFGGGGDQGGFGGGGGTCYCDYLCKANNDCCSASVCGGFKDSGTKQCTCSSTCGWLFAKPCCDWCNNSIPEPGGHGFTGDKDMGKCSFPGQKRMCNSCGEQTCLSNHFWGPCHGAGYKYPCGAGKFCGADGQCKW